MAVLRRRYPLSFLILLTLPGSLALEKPPTFTVDLAKPPSERWHGAVGAVLARHPFDAGFGPAFAAHNASLFDHLSVAQFGRIARAVDTHWPEHAAELAGISREFQEHGHAVSYEYLAAWTYFHELAHTELQSPTDTDVSRACTGILARDESTGRVLHGGNMDQSPPSVRNVTLHVQFVNGSSDVVFQGVDWYWFTTGVTRAVRKGVASLQENWRTTQVLRSADVFDKISRGVVPQVWVFRHALLAPPPPSWDVLVQDLATVPLAAPYYVVMAGPGANQGAILARNATGAEQIDSLSTAATTPPPPSFLVQTNYDRWKPDSASDPRRTAAEQMMRDIGAAEAAGPMGMYAVLSAFPVHNPHTAYSAVMRPDTGELHAFVRQAMCPSVPGDSIVRDSRYCVAT